MNSPAKAIVARSSSVRDDWFAGLPDEKHQVFDAAVGKLESAYRMLSVSLDEAFGVREKGNLVRAREQVAISADLLDRLAERLLGTLAVLGEYAQGLGKRPRVTPLNPDFFRGPMARRTAAWQALLQAFLVTKRARFSHKVRALVRTVEELADEFRGAADEIAEGASIHPQTCWEALDCLHYDLNTCLRETIVVLKSFLLNLPAEQFEAFRRRLEAPVRVMLRRPGPRFSRVST